MWSCLRFFDLVLVWLGMIEAMRMLVYIEREREREREVGRPDHRKGDGQVLYEWFQKVLYAKGNGREGISGI